ncbi:MAG: hypothetical protein GWN01_09935 [Nitrosopumilaceae archaeon]|nr:hypothetical protein [Nitrosopumilaceae archaeon]NIX61827.1 hypothetical protein [Nitrosopumilaceae archaeon]
MTNDHHEKIFNAVDYASNYKYELVNINIPPRCSKTEIMINTVARGIGNNPASNWFYITASDELRQEFSTRVRSIITHPFFKIMYGVELKKDQNAKNLWRTNKGGGLKTATIFGQITGFGAGQMKDELLNELRVFEGAIILDDVNKIDDAERMNAINNRVERILLNTIPSRKNSPDTPIFNIQQRAGMRDATAVLSEMFESQNKAEKVLNVTMPAIDSEGNSIWEKQLPISDLIGRRDSPLTSRMFRSQYMQEPVPEEGGIIKRDWIKIIRPQASFGKKQIFIDGAFTENKKNDPSGVLTVSFYNNKLIVHDFTEKWQVLPDFIDFIKNDYIKINRCNHTTPIIVEPKASGLDFKNTISGKIMNPVIEISKKNGSKFILVSKEERANTISDYVKAGMVECVEGSWNDNFINYLCNFPNDLHDEAMDLLAYAVERNLMSRQSFEINYGA